MHTVVLTAALVVLGRGVAPPMDSLTGLGFLKNGSVLIGTEETGLNVYGPEGKVRTKLRPPGVARLAALSEDTARALLAVEGRAEVMDTATAKSVCTFRADQYLVGPARFSADGKRVLTTAPSTGQDRQFALWSATTCEELRRFKGHTGSPISSLTFGPEEKTVRSWNGDAVLEWDAATGALQRELTGSRPPTVALPGGKALRVEGSSLELVTADGKPEAQWSLPATNAYAVAALPGTALVVIGGQSAAFLLNVAAPGSTPEPMVPRQAVGHEFVAVSASPDGKRALLADRFGETMLFDIKRRAVVWWAKLPAVARPRAGARPE